MTLKAAIFDWDGTITDSNGIKTEAFVELFQSACPQAAGYIREYQQNRGGISRFKKIPPLHPPFFPPRSLCCRTGRLRPPLRGPLPAKAPERSFYSRRRGNAAQTVLCKNSRFHRYRFAGRRNQRTRRRPQPAAVDSSYIWLAANQRHSAGRTAGRKPPCSRRNGIFWRRSGRLRSRSNQQNSVYRNISRRKNLPVSAAYNRRLNHRP